MNEEFRKVGGNNESNQLSQATWNFLNNLALGFKRLQEIQFDAPWGRR